MVALIQSYPSLFSDVPSHTHLIEHDMDVGDMADKSVLLAQNLHFYWVSLDKQQHLDQEVKYMLDNIT